MVSEAFNGVVVSNGLSKSNAKGDKKVLTREQKFELLESWTDALANTVKDMLPQMRKILEGQTELSDGCPSKESMAGLVFGQVEERFSEVENAMNLVRTALRE